MKIKTIDINALEWFIRGAGNSYFAATITMNFGMKDAKSILLPFQYGYGDHYLDMAMRELIIQKFIKGAEFYKNGGSESLWNYCDRKKIILRYSKQTYCKQIELKDLHVS